MQKTLFATTSKQPKAQVPQVPKHKAKAKAKSKVPKVPQVARPKLKAKAKVPKATKRLQNVNVLHDYFQQLRGHNWTRSTPMQRVERVSDALFTHNTSALHEMAFELALEVAPTKLKEIAAKYVLKAREGLLKGMDMENQRFRRLAQIDAALDAASAAPPPEEDEDVPQVPKVPKVPKVPQVPQVPKDDQVPDDLTDDAVCKSLQLSFTFGTPDPPSASPKESATPTEFKYLVDKEFKKQDHWETSKRGTSGFKHVSFDRTKTKP